MRKFATYGSLVVLTLITLAPAANASACSTSSLTSYLSGGFTCQVGAATASDFSAVLVSAFGTPNSTNAVTVVPTGGMSNPGFSFNAGYNASGLLAADSLTLIYNLSVPQGQSLTAATLSLTNPAVSGLGTLVVGELLCLNGQFILDICTGGVQLDVGTLSNALGNLNATLSVTLGNQPVTELGVLKTISLTGALGGSASASGLNNGYTIVTTTPVPEPSSMVLIGSGLLSLAGLQRRWLRR